MLHIDSLTLEMVLKIVQFLCFFCSFLIGGMACFFYFTNQEQKEPTLEKLRQDEIAKRWANPEYLVVSKARRSPFPQEAINRHHEEALSMIEQKLNLSSPFGMIFCRGLRTPFSKEALNNAHAEALKINL